MNAGEIVSYAYPGILSIGIVAVALKIRGTASKILIIIGLGLGIFLFIAEKILQANNIHYWQWPVPVVTIVYMLLNILLVAGFFLIQSNPTPNLQNQTSSFVNPTMPRPKWQPVLSKAFFLSSCFIGITLGLILIVSGIAMLISTNGREPEPSIALIYIGCVPLLYSSVVNLIFMYKIWSIFPAGTARTTPGKAIGYLFIPFYNFYWVIVAYKGWAQDYNKLIASNNISAPVFPEGLATAICILTIISAVPYLGVVATIPFIVFQAIFILKASDCSNAVIRHFSTTV